MSAGRPAQRGGSLRRHINVATNDGLIDDGLLEGDREPPSGDNLVAGDVPEEDEVDHRVEPGTWLTDGSAEGASGGLESEQRARSDPAGDADRLRVDNPAARDIPLPGNAAYASAGQDIPPPAERVTAPPYQRQAPPYPAQVPPAPSPGVAARVTAPFAALTRPRGRRPTGPSGPVQALGRPSAGPRPGPPKGAAQPTRRAQLVLSRIEPWSVMKFSFMVSLVGWVVLFVAVAALYYVLSKLGVFHSIQATITSVTSGKDSTGADANGKWFSASRILGYTMLVGAINVVLITALATVGAVIYNLVTHLAGGIEVTLKETD
jgi:hypothetical protein